MTTDAFAPAYMTLVVATKSRSRYWDGDAVRTPVGDNTHSGGITGARMPDNNGDERGGMMQKTASNPAGAPLLDWWLIPDETVVERLVLSMCPRRVCVTCGEPSRRITADNPELADVKERLRGKWQSGGLERGNKRPKGADREDVSGHQITLGWTDCGHNSWRPGVIYDPFQRNENDVTTRFLIGDVFDGLATIPDNSVDLIVSSPPFLALRSYLPTDHPDKPLEIGSEATPGAFLDKLLDVVEACARVLAPHGSLVFELGDTYAGSGGGGGDYLPGGLREGQPGFAGSASRERHYEECPRFYSVPDSAAAELLCRCEYLAQRDGNAAHWRAKNAQRDAWPLDKSKVLVPQLFAIALAYGFNPLTGRTTEPWRVRNTVAWCRPNPPVGRDGDKFRPATSFLTVATKARDRYWDGDAVRNSAPSENSHARGPKWNDGKRVAPTQTTGSRRDDGQPYYNDGAGAPLLDYWVIPTEPYSGSHYATFPRALVVPLVKSMCPQKVCRVCGEPSRRIVGEVEHRPIVHALGIADPHTDERKAYNAGHQGTRVAETLGWSDCGHAACPACGVERADYAGPNGAWLPMCPNCGNERDPERAWRPGLVLDPFCGSGTTLAVASGHGLDSIGIDLDSRNSELAAERVGGLFLEIETLSSAAVDSTERARLENPRFRAGYQAIGTDGPHGGPLKKAYGA